MYSPDETADKIRKMFTDPEKLRRNDPGRPEICPVFKLHRLYSPRPHTEEIDRTCRTGALGCVDCKKGLTGHLNDALAQIRDSRAGWAKRPDDVWDLLGAGAARARARAEETMAMVRHAMSLA